MKKIINSKTFKIVAIIVIAALFFVRIINIDQDLPPWSIANYQPADEGPYAMMAINAESYGHINPAHIEGEQFITDTSQNFITNIIGNGLNIIGFNIFGDNYWGLRLPYVFIAFLNLLLFAVILLEIKKKYAPKDSNSDWLIIGLLLWQVLDFCFYMASRVVEPSSLRMLFAQLMLLVYLKMPNSGRIRFFLLGAIVTVSVLLVYITNIFLYLAVGLTLLYIWKISGFKVFLKNTVWFIFGVTAAFIIAEAYYIIVWDTNPIANAFDTVRGFSTTSNSYEIINLGSSGAFSKVVNEFVSFFSSNPLFYNLMYLFGFIVFLPLTVYQLVKKKDNTICLMFSVLISLLMQTIVSNDYIIRKFIVVMPYMIFLLLIMYYKRSETEEMIVNLKQRIKPRLFKWLHVGYYLLALAFICYVIYIRLKNDPSGVNVDMTSIDKYFVFGCGFLPVVIILITKVYRIWKSNDKKININRTIGILLTLTCLMNLSFVSRYIWMNPTFTERDAMIRLGDEVDGKYVFGVGYQLGFSLYNKMKPVVGTPEVLRSYLKDNPVALLFDYADNYPGMRAYFDSYIFGNTGVSAFPVYSVERTFKAFGLERNMNLYYAKPMEYIVREYLKKYQEADDLIKELNIVDVAKLSESEKEKHDKKFKEAKEFISKKQYDDYYGDIHSDINTITYTSIYGTIYGDVNTDIYGDIYGNVYGNIYGDIFGTIYGDVFGEIEGDVHKIAGDICS